MLSACSMPLSFLVGLNDEFFLEGLGAAGMDSRIQQGCPYVGGEADVNRGKWYASSWNGSEGGGQWLKAGTENLAKSVHCCPSGWCHSLQTHPDTSLSQDAAMSSRLAEGLAHVQTVTNTAQNSRLLTQCMSWKMQPRFLKSQPRTHLHNGYFQLNLDYISWCRKTIQSLTQGTWCVCLGDKR